MEAYQDTRILIIDDDVLFCNMMREFLAHWGMLADSAPDAATAFEKLREGKYDLFLLDVCMPDANGLDLIPEIRKQCPDTFIIITSGYADKDTAIHALRLGAFDFLEKPFPLDLLLHGVKRALTTRDTHRELKRLILDLEMKQAELVASKKQLEYLNNQLRDTNKALAVFAHNIDREREEMESRIALKVKTTIMPILDKLRHTSNPEKNKLELDILAGQVDDLTSDFNPNSQLSATLTSCELRVAFLIKNGLTSEEIAEHLHVSPATVRTHRKNIRRKLKLTNGKYSLKNFLLLKKAEKADL
jgi:DNA-binding NarL/FixJ family response regulator